MPTSTYEHITTTTLGASTSSVSFTSITSAYTDLVMVLNVKSSADGNVITVRVNNDSTSGNYLWGYLTLHTSTTTTTVQSGVANRGGSQTYGVIAWDACPTSDGQNFISVVNFNNYSDTSKYKTILARSGSAASSQYNGNEIIISEWASTSAINRIDYEITSGTFSSGSKFSLYGIKAS